jgi:hypothetical protein
VAEAVAAADSFSAGARHMITSEELGESCFVSANINEPASMFEHIFTLSSTEPD